MKRFILPLAVALLLTGCTAGSPAATPSTTTEIQAVQASADRRSWANEVFNDRTYQAPVKSWSSPKAGTLNIIIGGEDWQEYDLRHVAEEIMYESGPKHPDLKEIHVSTSDGSLTIGYARSMADGLN